MLRTVAAVMLVAQMPTAHAALTAGRMRCDGSDFGATHHPGTSYAVRHDAALHLTWAPEGAAVGVGQSAYHITIEDLHTGETVWDTAMTNSTLPKAVYPGDTQPLAPGHRHRWSVQWHSSVGEVSAVQSAFFHTGLAAKSWDNVAWIGSNTTNVYRAPFTVPEGGKTVLYISGLAYSKATVNGVPVAAVELTTAPWTVYQKVVMYSVFDITHLTTGVNELEVGLGSGWRDSEFGRKEGEGDFTPRVLRCIVEVLQGNATTRVLTTSDKWTTASGPIVSDSTYNGETYDARQEISNATAWEDAKTVSSPPTGVMLPWSAPQVAVSREVVPVAITEPKPGVFVVDFGVNLAGVCRLHNINLPAGANVTLRHAEVLQHAGLPGIVVEAGMVYTANLRSAKATDVYISRGAQDATYQPSFTYHGFRYVEVTGLTSPPQIVMRHFHSAVAQRTSVNFSSPLLTALQKMAVGSQRSNMMTILTDCDQRDERLGWMGDAALSADTLALNYDIGTFFRFTSLLQSYDLGSDGSLPDVVPWVRFGGRPADVSWSLAFIQVIYVNWKTNGDVTTVNTFMDAMVRHQANVHAQELAAPNISRMHTSYGDWVPPPHTEGKQSTAVKPDYAYTTVFSYIMMTDMIGQMAVAVHNTSVAATMQSEVTRLRAAFVAAYYKNGVFDKNIQTDSSLAIAAGVAQSGENGTTADQLLARVVSEGHHFSTGIIGFKFLFDGLHNAGHASDALTILEGTTYPSLGYMLTNSMERTTENLWEVIDAPLEGPGMNSRNHHMYSSYSSYLVRRIAGVDVRGDNILLTHPKGTDLSWASTAVELPNGRLEYTWERAGGVQSAKGFVGDGAEAGLLSLQCGVKGGVVEEVLFASFGTPSGRSTLGASKVNATCHHPNSRTLVSSLCMGKAACTVPLSGLKSTLSCGTHMRATVRCSGAVQTRVDVVIPVGSHAVLESGESEGGRVLPSGASSFYL